VETHITEIAWDNGWVKPLRPAVASGFSVQRVFGGRYRRRTGGTVSRRAPASRVMR